MPSSSSESPSAGHNRSRTAVWWAVVVTSVLSVLLLMFVFRSQSPVAAVTVSSKKDLQEPRVITIATTTTLNASHFQNPPRRRLSIAERVAANRSGEADPPPFTRDHPMIVDVFLDYRGHTLVVLNTRGEIWHHGGDNKSSMYDVVWTCTSINIDLSTDNNASLGISVESKFQKMETHFHAQIIDFGPNFKEGSLLLIRSAFREYGTVRLQRGVLAKQTATAKQKKDGEYPFHFCAMVFSRETDPQVYLQWLRHHHDPRVGVERTLVYLNSRDSLSDKFIAKLQAAIAKTKFANQVIWIPFFLHHDEKYADQQAQGLHGLYSSKGYCRWLLTNDIDAFLVVAPTKQWAPRGEWPPSPIRAIWRNPTDKTYALQIATYKVDGRGFLVNSPQYNTDGKGKVILHTKTVTGFSNHMVTDIVGGNPQHHEISPLHYHVRPSLARNVHFYRTMYLLRPPSAVPELLESMRRQFRAQVEAEIKERRLLEKKGVVLFRPDPDLPKELQQY